MDTHLGLDALTHDQLVVLEEVLGKKFDAAYHQAAEEIATMGSVSADLSERLRSTQAMHAEVVQALQRETVRHRTN
jgi:hypothetical protein